MSLSQKAKNKILLKIGSSRSRYSSALDSTKRIRIESLLQLPVSSTQYWPVIRDQRPPGRRLVTVEEPLSQGRHASLKIINADCSPRRCQRNCTVGWFGKSPRPNATIQPKRGKLRLAVFVQPCSRPMSQFHSIETTDSFRRPITWTISTLKRRKSTPNRFHITYE